MSQNQQHTGRVIEYGKHGSGQIQIDDGGRAFFRGEGFTVGDKVRFSLKSGSGSLMVADGVQIIGAGAAPPKAPSGRLTGTILTLPACGGGLIRAADGLQAVYFDADRRGVRLRVGDRVSFGAKPYGEGYIAKKVQKA